MNDLGLLNFELHIDILIYDILLEHTQAAAPTDSPTTEDPLASAATSTTPALHYTSDMYTDVSTSDTRESGSSSSEFE